MKRRVAWLLLISFCITLIPIIRGNAGGRTRVSLDDFREQLLAGNVAHVSVWNGELSGEFDRPIELATGPVTQFRAALPPGTSGDWNFTNWLLENSNGAVIDAEPVAGTPGEILVALLPHLHWPVAVGVVLFLVVRQMRAAPKPVPVVVVDAPTAGTGPTKPSA